MSIDDTLKGVREYAKRIGFPETRFGELREVYNSTRNKYEQQEPLPHPGYNERAGTYQQRVLEWIHEGEKIAAQSTRMYAKAEIRKINPKEHDNN